MVNPTTAAFAVHSKKDVMVRQLAIQPHSKIETNSNNLKRKNQIIDKTERRNAEQNKREKREQTERRRNYPRVFSGGGTLIISREE